MPAQTDDDGTLPTRGGIPFPIAPRKKAAILITIILLSILQIAFGAISLQFIYRHSGYGRRGAWARPWNEDGVPGMAVFNGVIPLAIFGGNGLSELHPRHPCYSRSGTIWGAVAMIWIILQSSTDAIDFAWHFLSFGREDRDAYWLGVWTVCSFTVTVFNVAAMATYCMLAVKAINREKAEANISEVRETDRLLGSGTQHESPEIISHA
ncbi:hypothetical protein EDB81DRAFT_33113 [Dactylonectria macrodidyma]|uniref:Uncharacterized protein n=1 Tax=Dactylonectria macrodidyma TaxID=307937 RepID=A0A9P9FTX2_9HYPO|nr:hypothetical protein EDB81DRAFT_33113 [Dactylonectria macrodidyma]